MNVYVDTTHNTLLICTICMLSYQFKNQCKYNFKNNIFSVPRQRAQWLRILAAFSVYLGLIPRMHMAAQNGLSLLPRGTASLLLASASTRNTQGAWIDIELKCPNTRIKFIFLNKKKAKCLLWLWCYIAYRLLSLREKN